MQIEAPIPIKRNAIEDVDVDLIAIEDFDAEEDEAIIHSETTIEGPLFVVPPN